MQQQQQQQQQQQHEEERYTADGLKMASPRRPVALSPSERTKTRLLEGEGAEGGGGEFASPGRDLFDGVSTSAAASTRDDGEEEGETGGFDWEEGYENMEAQVAEMEEASTGYGDGGGLEGPAGGYPKRLAGVMSFCRVSDKATCEILVEMGRVTVNGEVAGDPGVKVDILTDIVVANGEGSIWLGWVGLG